MFTQDFVDCNNPLYLFFGNYDSRKNDYSFYFTTKTHSGEFSVSYKANNLFTNENELLTENYKDLKIDGYNLLPNYRINIIKLQCKEPGIISYFFNYDMKGYPSLSTTFIIANSSTEMTFYNIVKPNLKVYIEMFNLFGCIGIDLTKFDGPNYSGNCGNFATSYTTKKTSENYAIGVKCNVLSSIFSIINFGEINAIIMNENENKIISNNGLIYIPLKIRTDKKFIKIQSSYNHFYWTFEFSTQTDINFLRKDLTFISVKKNYTFIPNPYTFNSIKNDYNWYIVLKHNHLDKSLIFNYEYVDEKEEEKKENEKENEKENNNNEDNKKEGNEKENNNDKNNEDNKKQENDKSGKINQNNVVDNLFFWLFIVAIIAVIGLIIYIIIIKHKNNKNNLDKEEDINNAKPILN